MHGPVPYGILVELSQTGIGADNMVANAANGITVLDSGHMQIFNNAFSGDTMRKRNIGLIQDARWRSAMTSDRVCRAVGGALQLEDRGVMIADNVLDQAAGYQIYALDARSNVAPD